MTTQETFWMVQGSDGRPQVRHSSRMIAEKEASRLAAKNPGSEFFVMQAVAAYQSVSTIRVSLDGFDTDGAPPF